jgi:hypothetical protein
VTFFDPNHKFTTIFFPFGMPKKDFLASKCSLFAHILAFEGKSYRLQRALSTIAVNQSDNKEDSITSMAN